MMPEDTNGLQLKYFVLKPGGNDSYARASREALVSYANAIQAEDPKLAHAVMEWAITEESRAGGTK